MAIVKKLRIDGVSYDLWDDAAVHEETLSESLINVFATADGRAVIRELLYPVGSIYIGPDPTSFLGGQWQQQKDVMIVGAGGKYSVGATGGSADAVVIKHKHTATSSSNSTGAHTHSVSGTAASAGGHTHSLGDIFSGGQGSLDKYMTTSKRSSKVRSTLTAGTHTHNVSGTAASAGGHSHTVTTTLADTGVEGTGKNMPPYKAYPIWERIG